MREEMNFSYAGVSSKDMGVLVISQSSGLYEENLLPNRRIIEEITPYSYKPIFHGLQYEPMAFTMRVFLEEWHKRDNLDEVLDWLFKEEYQPIYFENNPNRIAYAIIEGSSTLKHNGAKDGYFDINIRCSSPFTYSNVLEESGEVLGSPLEFTILVDSYFNVKPKMSIVKNVAKGDIKIESLTSNKTTILSDIGEGETVYIDFENEEIVSSYEQVGVYRYDNFNYEWFELVKKRENKIRITGDCNFKIEYQSVYHGFK